MNNGVVAIQANTHEDKSRKEQTENSSKWENPTEKVPSNPRNCSIPCDLRNCFTRNIKLINSIGAGFRYPQSPTLLIFYRTQFVKELNKTLVFTYLWCYIVYLCGHHQKCNEEISNGQMKKQEIHRAQPSLMFS